MTVTPTPVAPRIVSFEINHFRADKRFESLGPIGESSGPILFNDEVRIRARLDVPAYFYLFALNPDGEVQLCHPSKKTEPPPRLDEIVYPGGNLYFPFTDGTGFQAFVLIASSRPLPAFAEWDGQRTLHWKTVEANDAGIWRFDGHEFTPVTLEQRGTPRPHAGPPRPFEEVCQSVTKLSGVDAVHAFAFPVVKPKN